MSTAVKMLYRPAADMKDLSTENMLSFEIYSCP